MRPRTILYLVLLLAGAGVASWAWSTVKPASFGVLRMTGAPYIVDDDSVRNQFLVRIVNKRNTAAAFVVRIEHAPTELRQVGFGTAVDVPPLGEIVQPLIVQEPRHRYTGPFHFDVRVEDAARSFQLRREVEFVGPEPGLLQQENRHDAP